MCATQVSGDTHVFWPIHDGEGSEAGGEPSIQDILVLLEGERLAVSERLGPLGRLLECSPNDPVLSVDFLFNGEYQHCKRPSRLLTRSRPVPRPRR